MRLIDFSLSSVVRFLLITIGFFISNTQVLAETRTETFVKAEQRIIVGDLDGLRDLLNDSPHKHALLYSLDPSMLHLAAAVGNAEAAKALMNAGSPVDKKEPEFGWTPLMLALYNGHEQVARELILRGANRDVVGRDNSTPVSLARFSGLLHVIPERRGSRQLSLPKTELASLLAAASEAGDDDLVVQLLGMGGDPHFRGENGWSALHYAAFRQEIDLFRTLSRGSVFDFANEHLEDGISLVQATLLGRRAKTFVSDGHALKFLKILVNEYDINLFEATETNSNSELAVGLGYSEDVTFLFGPPPIEPILPAFTLKDKMSRSDWRDVQRELASYGAYEGPIDGLPGKGTKRALYVYFLAFFEQMVEQSQPLCDFIIKHGFLDSELRFENYNIDRSGGIFFTSPRYGYIGYYCSKTLKNTHASSGLWTALLAPEADLPGNRRVDAAVYRPSSNDATESIKRFIVYNSVSVVLDTVKDGSHDVFELNVDHGFRNVLREEFYHE